MKRWLGVVLVGALTVPAWAQEPKDQPERSEVQVEAPGTRVRKDAKGNVEVEAPAARVRKDAKGNVRVEAPGVVVERDERGVRVRTPFGVVNVPRDEQRDGQRRERGGEQEEARFVVVGERRAYLGVMIGPVPEVVVAQFPDVFKEGRGALVTSIAADSPAAKAGIKPLDIIVQVGEQKVRSPEHLSELIRQHKPGEKVSLWVLRRGKLERVEAELGERLEPIRPFGHRFGPSGRLRRMPGRPAPFRPGPPHQMPPLRPFRGFVQLSIRTIDDNKVAVHAEWSAEGQRRSLEVEGSIEEVREKIEQADIPEDVKKMILRHLDRPRGRGFGWRFRMEPFFRFDDEDSFFFGPRFWLDRDGRRLDIWIQPGSPDAEAIEEWLEDLPDDLPPELRERIERALRRMLRLYGGDEERHEHREQHHERHRHQRQRRERDENRVL